MGWFKQNKEGEIPELPELPELTKLSERNYDRESEPLQQLPSIPSNKLGEKFSQNLIKEAVSGEKEEEEADEGLREFPRMMHPPIKPRTEEISEFKPIPREYESFGKKDKIEPIFIRIDKFEESLKIFESTKSRIFEIEKMLRDIKRLKEEEEKELEIWEQEIQNLKQQIEKVDQDIFSKVD